MPSMGLGNPFDQNQKSMMQYTLFIMFPLNGIWSKMQICTCMGFIL